MDSYLYSPELEECASCGEHMNLKRGFGMVALDVPGRPKLHYSLCNSCAPRLECRNRYFRERLGKRLIARAGKLGADGRLIDTKSREVANANQR